MATRPFMRGPLGGYVNEPVISKWTTTTTQTFTVRPETGEKWAPTFVSAVCVESSGGKLWDGSIRIYDGTTSYSIAHVASKAVGDSVTYGSNASGPIILTNDVYMQIIITTVTGAPEVHVIAICQRTSP